MQNTKNVLTNDMHHLKFVIYEKVKEKDIYGGSTKQVSRDYSAAFQKANKFICRWLIRKSTKSKQNKKSLFFLK